MAEGSDWAFSWFKQSPNQTLEKQTLEKIAGCKQPSLVEWTFKQFGQKKSDL